MVIIMKKIFAILVSLLFLVSVFGVAQTMAAATNPEKPDYCDSEYYKISGNSAKVGETFTISLSVVPIDPLNDVKIQGKTVDEITNGIVVNGGLPYRIGPVELIQVDYYDVNWNLIHSGLVLPGEWGPEWSNVKWIKWTFRAVSPGTLNLTNGNCGDTETVPILSKDLPFKFFAKLFGFGKKD